MSTEEKPKKVYHVNKILQIILIFIPLFNLWAWWRVEKLGKGIGLNFLSGGISYVSLFIIGIIFPLNTDFGLVFLIISVIASYIPVIYFMNKWTDERNTLYYKQESKIG